ncbi:MAG TPA: peptidoglycan DD-metalloendopeptidase family protein [Cytophagaceae bacterium]|jgi:septal ring factor EnvC (AmiA/AmiB activator)|nr:peptidoglycan DD-metalloendopeptidase family protein [Cytophagaceae bacterium]
MRNNSSRLYLFVFILVCSLGSFHLAAQTKSRKQLEERKGASLKKIEETNKILNQTREQKESNLTKLNLIKQKIKVQETLIQTINEEIEVYDMEIRQSESIIIALDQDIVEMKKEYARMVVIAYKYSGSFDKMAYIFGADNFRQMVLRYQYFKQYSALRTNQLTQIQLVTRTLERQRAHLLKKRNEKAKLAGLKIKEANNLNVAKTQHDEMLKELSAKETQLREELEESKKALLKLEKLIVDLIEEERRKAIAAEKKAAALAAAAKKTNKKSSSDSKATAASNKAIKDLHHNVALSSNFANNMGKLPWPVNKGRISQHFGKQPHPVLKGVYVENLGVDIVTVTGEPIKAVFAGKVLTVAQVPGMNYVVMIQHGESFFTVYAKLKSVTVTTGQQVQRNEILGEVYTDKSNTSELQFQIWKNEQKLDPESWLYDK